VKSGEHPDGSDSTVTPHLSLRVAQILRAVLTPIALRLSARPGRSVRGPLSTFVSIRRNCIAQSTSVCLVRDPQCRRSTVGVARPRGADSDRRPVHSERAADRGAVGACG
jgi:hypothetical protein